jgi:hypothetical protein
VGCDLVADVTRISRLAAVYENYGLRVVGRLRESRRRE